MTRKLHANFLRKATAIYIMEVTEKHVEHAHRKQLKYTYTDNQLVCRNYYQCDFRLENYKM